MITFLCVLLVCLTVIYCVNTVCDTVIKTYESEELDLFDEDEQDDIDEEASKTPYPAFDDVVQTVQELLGGDD